jgi:hypothetical protein
MAATTARKSAAKKTTAPRVPRVVKPRPAVVAEAEQPAVGGIVLDADRPVAPVDVFEIFAIGDKRYYAPARPHARVELTYLYKTRHEGPDAANGYLLEELVGHEGYVALMGYEALTADDLDRIFGLLREALQGAAAAMNGPKGKLRIA